MLPFLFIDVTHDDEILQSSSREETDSEKGQIYFLVRLNDKNTAFLQPDDDSIAIILYAGFALYVTERNPVRAQYVALIDLLAILVIESGKLADGIGVNLITLIPVQHTFLLPIINDVRIIILFIEISVCPFPTINSTCFEFDCSFHR